ncbi:hypothetical protein BDW68DRAFT_150359 [Aspergillus falconensis]
MRVHYRTSRLSRIPPCPATRKRSDHQSLLNSRRKLGFSARSTADDRPVSRYVSFFGFPTVICSRSKSSSIGKLYTKLVTLEHCLWINHYLVLSMHLGVPARSSSRSKPSGLHIINIHLF